jgi:hypothetical protein
MAEELKAGLSGAYGNDKDKSEMYANTAEYFTALEKWLHDVYMWHSITAAFPYALITNQFAPAGAMNVQHIGGSQSGPSIFPYMTYMQNSSALHNRRPQVATIRPTQHQQHAVAEEG